MLEEQSTQLDHDGYILLRGVLTGPEIEALRTRLEELWHMEGEQAGMGNTVELNARRLTNLANKGEMFVRLMCDLRVLEEVRAVIGPEVRLNMLNARDALPHSDSEQPLHVDTDHGGLPDAQGYYVATAIWMLDHFTRANGATHLVPGSHRSGKVPKQVLADVYARHPDEVVIEGNAGDVLVFNGHCWHSGGANETDHSRRAVLVHYIRSDHAPRLDYRAALSPGTQELLDPFAREILGLL